MAIVAKCVCSVWILHAWAGGRVVSVWVCYLPQHKLVVAKKPPMYKHLPCGLGDVGRRDVMQAVMKPARPVGIIHVLLWEGQER